MQKSLNSDKQLISKIFIGFLFTLIIFQTSCTNNNAIIINKNSIKEPHKENISSILHNEVLKIKKFDISQYVVSTFKLHARKEKKFCIIYCDDTNDIKKIIKLKKLITRIKEITTNRNMRTVSFSKKEDYSTIKDKTIILFNQFRDYIKEGYAEIIDNPNFVANTNNIYSLIITNDYYFITRVPDIHLKQKKKQNIIISYFSTTTL